MALCTNCEFYVDDQCIVTSLCPNFRPRNKAAAIDKVCCACGKQTDDTSGWFALNVTQWMCPKCWDSIGRSPG